MAMDEREIRTNAADELLSVVDTYGMSIEKAEQTLANKNASPEQVELADEVLADCDTYGLDEDKAVEIIAEDQTSGSA
jgi:hypothetical protein